ncbi:hypothetical protein AYO20_00240 [Fonsecaea nubica]|uniref:Metallo-beta-lactamase domain-containing protein n=1 Tax=Fonsecaea nubica TaxID=856822 RepID=A0A178DGQ2_9EURO|nr:hypothetical protein AYO20_00240 [Fonsecaea nubica]OAL40504.1 hypothetical protein AYO20_00240 [Fonsecaea nubica]
MASSGVSKLFNAPSGAVADVRIINCTSGITRLPASFLLHPPLQGMQYMPDIPTRSFLIESPTTGKKALFDLGVPPNFLDFSPFNQDQLRNPAWEIRSEKHVADILKENQIDPAWINSIVWSHRHFDHIGDPSTFPGSTELVVGPGSKQTFYPGYPTIKDSPSRWANHCRFRFDRGRETREINFDDGPPLQIGQFKAMDFFGDVRTIVKAQEADADDKVLFIYAHSKAVERYAELFPLKANQWKRKGWKRKVLWDFVRDFKVAVDAQSGGSAFNAAGE